MIVVLDTNVWISALVFAKKNGTPTQALARAINDDVIATCAEINEEIERVLMQKFGWSRQAVFSAMKLGLARSLRVTLSGNVRKCRDPHDDKFLECAYLAEAKLLVAGDQDLLVLESYEGIEIVTPAEYLRKSTDES